MIGSWELDQFDKPKLFHDLALAYLDSSIALLREMNKGAISSSYSHTRVILSLLHHSIELFLKGAVLKAGSEVKTSHNLRNLCDVYEMRFPRQEFHFYLPFDCIPLGFSPDETAKRKRKAFEQFDQMYRYHTDKNGNQWPGIAAFDPKTFLPELNSLYNRFVQLGKMIHEN